MIIENDDSTDAVNELVRKISIEETQLKSSHTFITNKAQPQRVIQ